MGRDFQDYTSARTSQHPACEPPPLAIDAWLDRLPSGRRRTQLAELVRADAVLTRQCGPLYPPAEPIARLAQLLLHTWAKSLDLDAAEIAMLLTDVNFELEAGLARLLRECEPFDEVAQQGEAAA